MILASLAVVVASHGCGSGSSADRSAVVTGGINYVGGPVSPVEIQHGRVAPVRNRRGYAGGHYRREPGRVIVRDGAGDTVASMSVRRDRTFRFGLSAGRYRLIAHTDDMRCRRSVRARANHIVSANLVCQIP